MKRLYDLIGTENPLDFNSRALRDFARTQKADLVGAMQITCSDESERECVESLQHWFAEDLLPSLKYSAQSPFRTATMGGRYEWGSLALAERNFTTPESEQGSKLLLVKINSHVAVVREGSGFAYGTMDRYGLESRFCGALHALLDGQQLPAVKNLREAFRSEGKDRVAMLNDSEQVDPQYRSLLAAVAGARLQARRAVLDIQNTTRPSPSLILVLPCVTMNRPDRDTELIVGAYTADFRERDAKIFYRGLGDDPSRYAVELRHNLLRLEDDGLHHDRPARDHRQMVLREWRKREGEVLIDDERVQEIVVLTGRTTSPSAAVAKEVLKTLLRLLADVALVPTAVVLFADGVAGIHNVYRAYRLAQGRGTRHDAEAILGEILERVDNLSPDQARAVIGQLCQSYGIPLEMDDDEEIAAAVAEMEITTDEISEEMTDRLADESPADQVEAALPPRAEAASPEGAPVEIELTAADIVDDDIVGGDIADAEIVDAEIAIAEIANAEIASADIASADIAGADIAGADIAGDDQPPEMQIGTVVDSTDADAVIDVEIMSIRDETKPIDLEAMNQPIEVHDERIDT